MSEFAPVGVRLSGCDCGACRNAYRAACDSQRTLWALRQPRPRPDPRVKAARILDEEFPRRAEEGP